MGAQAGVRAGRIIVMLVATIPLGHRRAEGSTGPMAGGRPGLRLLTEAHGPGEPPLQRRHRGYRRAAYLRRAQAGRGDHRQCAPGHAAGGVAGGVGGSVFPF